ncbi:ATPase family aaa domain-containing protein 1 [Paramicrosporidium saccamoebae]|uniref:ATPase family aaa domain-containing protein 1 n=1 Tax=Paramicrosporidium saccamoebae TaxID=1246581 RepID=A0A2H9TMG7_9FUNG|nr:ATPase family aaa domain-containing protein 1 [Paramicrosporidium saccamoebae]
MDQKALQFLNLFSISLLTGYLTAEYVWPFIKRRLWNRSSIQRRLRHEEELSYGALHPDEISTGFEDIGGNEEAILRLRQLTDLLLAPPTNASRLLHAPSGLLLYGPPGCGKTMIARALAKSSGVRFLSLNLATIMDKWVGETEKYIEALFSLARKIAPVIIFVDEIDALTRKRGAGEREWSSGMKAQLLTFWDGLQSDRTEGVIILGATNRPQDIDEAFLRRMPVQIKIDLPGLEQRAAILRILLEDLDTPDVIDVDLIAEMATGCSGSDIHEMARRTVLNTTLSKTIPDTESFLTELDLLQSEKINCRRYI